jgi:CPA1 family monovalent cation:H+ antiporter
MHGASEIRVVAHIFWLLLIAFCATLVARKAKAPYALALVITGLVIGIQRLLPHIRLDPTFLLMVFLPPMLFDSAINLRLDELKQNWRPITIYTLAGTIASALIVGVLAAIWLHAPLAVGLTFGALISTTDPISVIAIVKRLNAGRRLTLILEAESLFNNDTAVVLFTVTLAALAGHHVSPGASVLQFVYLVAGGAIFGSVVGLAATRIHNELDDQLVEISLTTLVAFGSYLGAESLHVSGVVAVIAAGIVVGSVSMHSAMSPGTRLAVTAFWEYAAFLVNSVVFLLIGIEVCYVDWRRGIGFTLVAIVMVLLGRASIYPLSIVVNRLGGAIPRSWQHVLFWGGLRGALSMALALDLSPAFPHRDAIISATFGVVLFSLLAQGLTVAPLLRHLGLTGTPKSTRERDEDRRLAAEIAACRAALQELNRLRGIETHPVWALDLLGREYEARLGALEDEMERRHPDSERERVTVRRSVLLAEKSAYFDAHHGGLLDDAAWKALERRIDAELVELRSHPPA